MSIIIELALIIELTLIHADKGVLSLSLSLLTRWLLDVPLVQTILIDLETPSKKPSQVQADSNHAVWVRGVERLHTSGGGEDD